MRQQINRFQSRSVEAINSGKSVISQKEVRLPGENVVDGL